MTKNELLTKCKELNEKYFSDNKRFESDGTLMKIGTHQKTFNLDTELDEVLEFINKYGMFKPTLKECSGHELYYKGYKWKDLTQTQQQSVIDLFKDNKYYTPDNHEQLFNNDRAFCSFC